MTDTSAYFLAFLIMAAICVPIGLWAWLKGRKLHRQAVASLGWPTVRGRVLKSDITVAFGPKRSRRYRPQVRYAYEVGGTRHEGAVVRFGLSELDSQARAAKVLEPYPEGAEVTVRYDPAAPATATLETDAGPARMWIWIGIGLLVFPPAITLLLYLIA